MWDPLINIFDVVPRHCINKLTTCVQNLVHFGATWKRWDKLFLPPAFLCGVTRTLIVKRNVLSSKLFWSYISSTGNIPLGLLLTSKLIRHYIMGQYLQWTGLICLPLSQGGVWSMKLCPPGLGIPPTKLICCDSCLLRLLPGVKFYLEPIRELIIIHSQTVDRFCVIFGSIYSYPWLTKSMKAQLYVGHYSII